jgi:ATP-binding cassette subfamily F protein 3
VVVVSHDRFFTDKIANRRLVFSAEASGHGSVDLQVA